MKPTFQRFSPSNELSTSVNILSQGITLESINRKSRLYSALSTNVSRENIPRIQSSNNQSNNKTLASLSKIRNISYMNMHRTQVKKLRIQSAVNIHQSRNAMRYSGVGFQTFQSDNQLQNMTVTNTKSQTGISRRGASPGPPNKVHIYVNNENMNVLAHNLNLQYIQKAQNKNTMPNMSRKTLKIPVKNADKSRKLLQEKMRQQFKTTNEKSHKNNLQNILESNSQESGKQALQSEKLERALNESRNCYCQFTNSHIQHTLTDSNQYTTIQSSKLDLSKGIINLNSKSTHYNDMSTPGHEMIDTTKDPLTMIQNQQIHQQSEVSLLDHANRNIKRAMGNFFTKQLNFRERAMNASKQSMREREKSALKTDQPSRVEMTKQPVLGPRQSDPKLKKYFKSQVRNLVSRNETKERYGTQMSTFQKKNKDIFTYDHLEPTNPKDDLSDIKHFRKIEFNKVKNDVIRKIEGPSREVTISNMNRSLSPRQQLHEPTTSSLVGRDTPDIQTSVFNAKSRIKSAHVKINQKKSKRKEEKYIETKKTMVSKMRKEFAKEKEQSLDLSEFSSQLSNREKETKNKEKCNVKFTDTNIMQQDNQKHEVVSTQLRIMAKLGGRRFLHKDNNLYENTFDPLRMKFKIITLRSMDNFQASGQEMHFKQAMKYCERNQVTRAIQEFKKGLSSNPNNIPCRFNHGVLMFKLGLVTQAISDFQRLVDLKSKDPIIPYNLAVAKVQLGNYQAALDLLPGVIDQCLSNLNAARNSTQKAEAISMYVHDMSVHSEEQRQIFQLLSDAHMLKATCLWRRDPSNVENPLEAVKNIKLGQRYKQWCKVNEKDKISPQELLRRLKDQLYKEMKLDIKSFYANYMSRRSRSVKVQRRKGLEQKKTNNQTYEQLNSLTPIPAMNIRKRMTFDHRQLDGVRSQLLRKRESLATRNLKNGPYQTMDQKIDEVDSFKSSSEGIEVIFEQSSKTSKEHSRSSFSDSNKSGKVKTFDNLTEREKPERVKKQTLSEKKKKLIKSASGNVVNPKEMQKKLLQNLKRKMSISKQIELIELKEELVARKIQEQNMRELFFKTKAQQFYNQFRQESMKKIDQGNGGRFDVVFSHLLMPFKETLENEYLEIINKSRMGSSNIMMVKLNRIFSRQQINEMGMISKEELQQIEFRQKMEGEFEENKNVVLPFSAEEQLMQIMMEDEEQGKAVNNREVQGSKFPGITEIIQNQNKLVSIKKHLDERVLQIGAYWDNEIQRTDKRIFQKNLRLIDINQYLVTSNKSKNNKDLELLSKDPIIQKMREIHESRTTIPDHICNVLELYLEEKQKKKQVDSYHFQNISTRLSYKALELIRHEFENHPGENRAFAILDTLLAHLKFFIRFGLAERRLVFEHAKFVKVPAQTTIFKAGDQGKNMYILIKGKVAVELGTEEEQNQYIIALLKDGEHFGELSLVDRKSFGKEMKNTGNPLLMRRETIDQEQFGTRKATCYTSEDCDMLELDQHTWTRIYQMEQERQKLKTLTTSSLGKSDDEDKLAKRISALKKVSYFSDVDAKLLMPIALNLQIKSYSYGEYLVKAGQVPPGLIIIIEGQCQVVSTRIGQRYLPEKKKDAKLSDIAPSKYGIFEPMLQSLDPDSSALNNPVSLNKCFQNQRLMIDSHGKEIKNFMQFNEIMKFSDLMTGSFFGARCLMPFEHYSSMKRLLFGDQSMEKYYPHGVPEEVIDSQHSENYHMKSLLSVVANSANVKVWIIDKVDMNYLPEKVLKQVFEKVIFSKEEDRPFHEQDIEFIIDQFCRWDKFKIDLVEQMFEVKAITKFMKAM